MSKPSGRLVYLSYGDEVHHHETLYSLYSIFRHRCPVPGVLDVTVYTDRPELYRHLPVDVATLDGELLESWLGPTRYLHRRKLMTIRTALAAADGPVAFIDSDTYFIADPAALFERSGEGRICLHLQEGRLDRAGGPSKATLRELVAAQTFPLPSGETWSFATDSPVWNSGVVGLTPDELGLVDTAVELVDIIWPKVPEVHDVEQFVLGCVLAARREVVPTDDVVFHYWSRPVRDPFRDRLPALVGAPEPQQGLNLQAERLWSERPRLRGRARTRYQVKEAVRRIGYVTPGPRSSTS